MNGSARRILKTVAKTGELSLNAAIQCAKAHNRSHIDQYSLALLLEEGYSGMTQNHTPPSGAERMREYSLAVALHMHNLPKNERGEAHYMGIISSGTIDPRNERVFLKAKGALYLDEQAQKRRDRLYSLIVAIGVSILAAVVSAWLLARFGLS